MKMGKNTKEAMKGPFVKHVSKIKLTPGMMIREIREKQELTQAQLAEMTGLKQSTISSLEKDRATLGIDRAKVLARALRVHPSVLAFPGWDIEKESAAYFKTTADQDNINAPQRIRRSSTQVY